MTDIAEFLRACITEDGENIRNAESLGVPIGHVLQNRLLKECEDKRAIVRLHRFEDPWDKVCATCTDQGNVHLGLGRPAAKWPCPTLRAMASVYSRYPGYDAEWRA